MSTEAFTLVEFYNVVQRTEDGHPYWEEHSCDVNGDLMVFDSAEDAAGMARFMLGADHDGPEREPRPEYAPLIGIIAYDYDLREALRDDADEDEGGWSYGWVDIDGTLHEGDYENDPEHWQTNPVQPDTREES